MSHVPEDEIVEFQNVTASSRRAAIWYITHNSDLNDAVSNFLDRGEAAIPDSFDPDELSGSSDADDMSDGGSSGPKSSDDESNDYVLPDLFSKSFPSEKEILEDKEETPVLLPQSNFDDIDDKNTSKQNDSTIIDAGAQLSYVLEPQPKVTTPPVQQQERDGHLFEVRKLEAKHTFFILWKDGYTFNDVFTPNSSINRESLLQAISQGKLPFDAGEFNDIQFINRIDENHVDDQQS